MRPVNSLLRSALVNRLHSTAGKTGSPLPITIRSLESDSPSFDPLRFSPVTVSDNVVLNSSHFIG
jgi:hypothetical protein